MAFGTATLTGFYQTFDGEPAEGVVEIIPNSRQLVDSEGNKIRSGRVKVTLVETTRDAFDDDGNPITETGGAFSVVLPATDDATVEPATGRQYTVVAKLRHTHLAAVTGVELATGATVDVADVASAPVVDPEVSLAATITQLAALEADVTADLATKADTTYVDTELATKQDAGDYATTTDLTTGLASKADTSSVPTAPEDIGAEPAGLSAATETALAATYARLAPAPTGDAAVDTPALQALIDAMPATGGVIRLQAGTYGMQGNLTINKPIEIVGLGSGDPYGTNAVTVLSYPWTTGNAINITSRGVRLRHFILKAASAHVSGSGIATTGADGLQLEDVVVSRFWINVDIDASEWLMDRCRIHAPRQYGARVRAVAMPDSGDWTISNSWFTTESHDCDASLRFESGGGGKITATKFNAHAVRNVDDTWEPGRALHHIDVALTSAATSSDFQVDPSCSFESTRGSLVHFAQDGASTAEFRNIILMGEFATYNSTATVPGTPAIEIKPVNGSGPFSNVLIDGVFLGEFGFGTAVEVDNVNYLEIRGVFQNWAEKWAVTNATYVRLPEPERRWIPAQQLAVSDNYGGTITRAAEGRSDAVKLSAAGFQTLAATLAPIPWNAYTVKVYWVNAGAGAGDVVWRYDFQNIGAGDTLDAAGTANSAVTATAGALDVVQVTTLATVAAAPADFLSARLIRVGDDAADTLGNDVAVLGLMVEKLN